ncbi:MAG: hypothetical protein R3C53_13840 [Pirellulaceae bacterium]
MLKSKTFPFLIAGWCACWLLVLVAHAQDEGLVLATVTGTMEAAAGNQIKFKSTDGQDYMAVMNTPKAKLRYSGTADPKFLQPGLFVRFTAAFDQKANIHAPLSQLEIFVPVQERRMSPEQIQEQTPGIYPVAQAQADGEGKAGDAEKNDVAPAPAGFENYRIVGKLAAIKGESMQVFAGRPLTVTFDPAVQITVTAGDATFCAVGDTIEVSGLQVEGQQNWISASTVTITGAKPLAPPEKKSRSPRKRGKADNAPAANDKQKK